MRRLEAKEDKSLVGVKIKVSSHQLGSFYRISGLMLPSFLTSAFFTKHLEIFQQAYRLNSLVFKIKKDLPKVLKYDLGDFVFSARFHVS